MSSTYPKKIGISAFYSGIAHLNIALDGNSKNISMLQIQLNRRSNNYGWNFKNGDILTIPNGNGVNKDLTLEFGCLTNVDIRVFLIYMEMETRKVQNNQMMDKCLLASLTEACFHK